METIFENSAFFALLLLLLCYQGAVWLQRKTKQEWLNPILVCAVFLWFILTQLDYDITLFEANTETLSFLLTPATICLAVPIYRYRHLLKKYWMEIIITLTISTILNAITLILLAALLDIDKTVLLSLLPKSVTTAIAMDISTQIGGLVPVTVFAVIISGVVGSIISHSICKYLKVTNPISIGLGIGSSAHAVGTSKAFEVDIAQGTMSSIAIVITGILTTILLPLIVLWI